MHTYNTYLHPTTGTHQVVRLGFAWPALYWGCFWMLSNMLWRRGLLCLSAYASLWCLGLLYIPQVQGGWQTILCLGISLGFLLLWLLPAFFGHLWCELHLNERGYIRHSIVYAPCAKGAQQQLHSQAHTTFSQPSWGNQAF